MKRIFFNGSKQKAAIDPLFLTARISRYNQRLNSAPSHMLKGKQPKAGDITLVSNDYLDFGNSRSVTGVKARALEHDGHGLLRSDVYRGDAGPLSRFENSLAKLVGSETAVLTQSGWSANVGLIQSIADKNVPVYLDMYVHFSLWEGVKSAGAMVRPFKHNDPDSLENMIKRYGPGVVAFETVYSTDGAVGPVRQLVEVAEKYGCVIVVDESHSLGVYGDQGEGMISDLGLASRVHFRTSSLSKAFAARGGVIAGSAENLEYFRYESLPAIFSSGILPYEAAGFSATLKLIQSGSSRRIRLHDNADFLRDGLADLGYNVNASKSQIIALESGTDLETILLRDALEGRGIFGSVFCWPATPQNRALVRFSVNSSLTGSQLGRVLQVCDEIRDDVNMWKWNSTRRNTVRPRSRLNVAARA